MIRTPRFWFNPPAAPGAVARLLTPLSLVWTAVARRSIARGPGARVGAPVICVGNLTVGGAGKTPVVIALAARLRARGREVHVISRGHGGSLPGPVRVVDGVHAAAEVGDEPLLHAAFGPAWIGRDRVEAARAAVGAGAEALVLDDGLQNPGLHKDLSVVVIDAAAGFGNGRVMPAGPLREPVADGLARADLALMIGADDACAELLRGWPALLRAPVLTGELRPLATGMDWRGVRALAFAGIARPEKFFATLRGLGAEVVAAHGLADHAPLDARLLARLTAEARAMDARLVTTEKDAARLPAGWRAQLLVLAVRLEVADWAPLDRGLERLGL